MNSFTPVHHSPASRRANIFCWLWMFLLFSPITASAQVNSWTGTQSGNWEDLTWSLGVRPTITHSAILLTNQGFKAVAIGIPTATNHPDTLTINNLTVSSPANSKNTLLLNYAGLQRPLRVLQRFELGTNSVLLSLFSSLEVGTEFAIEGTVNQAELAETSAHSITMGQLGAATYNLTNGTLAAGSMLVGSNLNSAFTGNSTGATFNQEGGTITIAGDLALIGAAHYYLQRGKLMASNLSVSPSPITRQASFFTQTGGVCNVVNQLAINRFSVVALQAGTLVASNFSINAGGFFHHSGGQLLNRGTFVIDSTYFQTVGQTEPLGRLRVTNNFRGFADPDPTIHLNRHPCLLKFSDSSNESSEPGITLNIINWTGSTNGGGTDQIIFGNSPAALSPSQLGHILFHNPGGLPPGTYYARILPSGEIVPTPSPTLLSSRSNNQMVLSWFGSFRLQTSTNVLGPYSNLTEATSPYTNLLPSVPERFFRLRD